MARGCCKLEVPKWQTPDHQVTHTVSNKNVAQQILVFGNICFTGTTCPMLAVAELFMLFLKILGVVAPVAYVIRIQVRHWVEYG